MFSRNKDCQKVIAVKNNLPKTKKEDVDLKGRNINKSLCPYCKVPWSRSKKLPS